MNFENKQFQDIGIYAPARNTTINNDDILNLTIALNTTGDVLEFLGVIA
jgi:hypothetical protein